MTQLRFSASPLSAIIVARMAQLQLSPASLADAIEAQQTPYLCDNLPKIRALAQILAADELGFFANYVNDYDYWASSGAAGKDTRRRAKLRKHRDFLHALCEFLHIAQCDYQQELERLLQRAFKHHFAVLYCELNKKMRKAIILSPIFASGLIFNGNRMCKLPPNFYRYSAAQREAIIQRRIIQHLPFIYRAYRNNATFVVRNYHFATRKGQEKIYAIPPLPALPHLPTPANYSGLISKSSIDASLRRI